MWLALLLPAIAVAEPTLFKEHREKFLDHSVSPCTHFFNHVCPKTLGQNRFSKRLQTQFENMLKPFMTEEALSFISELDKVFGGVRIARAAFYEQEVGGFDHPNASVQKRASDNGLSAEEELEVKEMIWKLCPALLKESQNACVDSNKDAYIQNQMSAFKSGMLGLQIGQMSLIGIMQYEAFHKFMEKNTVYIENEKEIMRAFNCSKASMVKEFENTPWMLKQRPGLIEILRKATLIGINKTTTDVHHLYPKAHKFFQSCVGEERGFQNKIVKLCLLKTGVEVLPEFAALVGHRETHVYLQNGPARINGVNSLKLATSGDEIVPESSELSIGGQPVLFGPIHGSLPELLGFGGMVLGHEFGHTAFPKGFSYYPSNAQCFQKQKDEVCRANFKAGCPPPENTFIEDAADYIAMHASLKTLNELTPNATAEDYQDLFYAHAIHWCNDGTGSKDGKHSSNVVRVNNVLRHFHEFSDAFQCQKGDYMRIEEEDRCEPLFGSGAPPKK